MPITARYVLMASMDVDPDRDAIFNEVYDTEHVPYLLEVPGVLSVTRATAEPLAMMLGGERRDMPLDGPRSTAIYEIESPARSEERRVGKEGVRTSRSRWSPYP